MKKLTLFLLSLAGAKFAEAATTFHCVNQNNENRALLVHYGSFKTLVAVPLRDKNSEDWVPNRKYPGINMEFGSLAVARYDDGEIVVVSRDLSEANVFDSTGKQTDHLSCSKL